MEGLPPPPTAICLHWFQMFVFLSSTSQQHNNTGSDTQACLSSLSLTHTHTHTHTCISESGGAELAHSVNLRSPVSMSHMDTSLFP